MNLPPDWMLPEGIGEVQRQRILRDWSHRERRTGGRVLPRVSLPVDASDAGQFPNISAASEWAQGQEQLQREWNEK